MTSATTPSADADVGIPADTTTPAERAFLEAFRRVLAVRLGADAVVGLTYHPVKPRHVEFFQQEPRTSFAGFSDAPLLSSSASLDSFGTRHHFRMERIELEATGSGVVATWTIERDQGLAKVRGAALGAAPGSPEESAFIEQVLGHVLEDMAMPLRSMLAAIRRSGLAPGQDLATSVHDKLR